MSNKPSTHGHLSRRSVLAGVTASTAFLNPLQTARASEPLLHDIVAEHVRALAGGKNLKLRLLLPRGARANVGPVITAFREMTGVEVLLHEADFDEINTELYLDALTGTDTYDVALPATFGVPDLVASGAILPISQYADRYEPAGFRDGIIFSVGDTFDGKIYGFQADGDAYTMFYHKGMLEDSQEQARYSDRYGRALKIPDTWEELDRQMDFFNRPDEGKWGGLLFRTPNYLAWEWWIRFHAKGVWPFSTEMTPQVASDEGVEALEEMIRATAHLAPEASRLGLFENWERYSQGDVYCNIGWGGSQKHLNATQSDIRNQMVYGPIPGGILQGKPLAMPYFNWGWNYVVASNSRQPEVAYLFCLFASTPEMSTLAVRQKDGFFDPFRAEHYEDAGIKEAYTAEFLSVQRASLESAIPDLYLQNQGEYFRVLNEWLMRALTGEVSPKNALERVSNRWWSITNTSGQKNQKARWAQLRAKYPKQIGLALRDLS
ncbi:transcriptional antiterminator [Roseobacter denitrificans]|uniref:Possible trehalose/maltose binding n=1 Tax=Roseobacter denitrificans (strain ATCC 33942 / OCh 114) TaxID=375451 RepID=Q16A71_ROSDO|nr:extracellular solute-binding protein [Roseobacter denitrificans]ABG31122.1 possible trehalose/maltose binding [Roseobacter denitrificans OCh 114]AVL54192.1 transcriptional antiterminator [Roseobacter denitrificans]SFG32585.1 carbohydrate ABC transporter substrate-binding protein, CUT1 family [Roseobacter denitrificans OCh 114]